LVHIGAVWLKLVRLENTKQKTQKPDSVWFCWTEKQSGVQFSFWTELRPCLSRCKCSKSCSWDFFSYSL